MSIEQIGKCTILIEFGYLQIIATVPMNDEAIGGFGLETHLVLLLCSRRAETSSEMNFSPTLLPLFLKSG